MTMALAWLAFFGSLLAACAGQDILRDKILKKGSYDKLVPPGNFAANVRMQIHFDILQLVEVVESEQWIKIRLWTSLYWWDERLSWDPNEAGGVGYVYVPPDLVWTPYIFVDNSAELQYTKPWAASEVNVSYAGRIAQKGYMVLITNCPMRVRAYPFDQQECPIMISTSDNKFQIGAETPTANFTVYSFEHSEFKIFDFDIRAGLPSNDADDKADESDSAAADSSSGGGEYDTGVITVTLTLYISRNALQHTIALVVPCTLICVLGVTGLFVSMDPKGERLERYRFGLTAVLSLVIFQLGLYERLPVSNDGIPVLSLYYNALFALICFATMATSIPLMMHAKGLRCEAFPHYLRFLLSIGGYPEDLRIRDRAALEASKRSLKHTTSSAPSEQTCLLDSSGGGFMAPHTPNAVTANGSSMPNWDAALRLPQCWCMEQNGEIMHELRHTAAHGGADYINMLAAAEYLAPGCAQEYFAGAAQQHQQQQQMHGGAQTMQQQLQVPSDKSAGGQQERPKTLEWIKLAEKTDTFLMAFFYGVLIFSNVAAFGTWASFPALNEGVRTAGGGAI